MCIFPGLSVQKYRGWFGHLLPKYPVIYQWDRGLAGYPKAGLSQGCSLLPENEREIAEFLVGSIDDMGYIRRSVADIVDDLAFPLEVLKCLKT